MNDDTSGSFRHSELKFRAVNRDECLRKLV
jgi:hypothetical protein